MKYFQVIVFIVCMVMANSLFADKQCFDDNYLYIVGDQIKVYDKGNQNSKVLCTVNTLRRVQVIDDTEENKMLYVETFVPVSKKTVKIDGKWRYQTFKGWVAVENLAGKNDFEIVKKTEEMFIKEITSEDTFYYHIYSDGRVKVKSESALEKAPSVFKMYKYKNIISFGHYYYFFYDSNNKLQSNFGEIEVITDKKDFLF